jgi:SulP family sulfate permease
MKSDLGEKGIIIESVENLNEKPWQDELPFYDEYKDKVNKALERTAIF